VEDVAEGEKERIVVVAIGRRASKLLVALSSDEKGRVPLAR
jgi:hypothetical protein